MFSLSQRSANGILRSVAKSFITASASGPNCAIGLPQRLYSCLNKRVSSLAVIGVTLRSSLTLSKKWRVNSTSMPTFANNLSAKTSSWSSSTCVNFLSTSVILIQLFMPKASSYIKNTMNAYVAKWNIWSNVCRRQNAGPSLLIPNTQSIFDLNQSMCQCAT